VSARAEHAPDDRLRPEFSVSGDGDRLALAGSLEIATLGQASAELKRLQGARELDLSGLERIDTPGALLLCNLRDKGVALAGLRAEHKSMLDLVGGLELKPLPGEQRRARWRDIAVRIGRASSSFRRDFIDIVAFLGRTASWTLGALLHPASLRPAAISRHVEETGVHALPIIGTMAVMIATVIGYQGVAQLRPFGGEDFTIDLVAVSMLREMGVLVTAIMVAGRSGSAYTAEIGVMKSREEVDALEVMGIEPMQVLVVPRVIALVVTLPLLTFFADMMGLLGGAVIFQSLLDVSPLQTVDRVRDAVDLSDLFVGLVKAPVFGLIIAIVSCMHGLRVTGSAGSVGRETTSAVVKSIFLVIVLDALFSVLFEKLGV
jgi:phospholipid/cholesterol/gamma-HCH transport system permease protein